MISQFFRMLWDFYGPVYPVVLAQQFKRYYYEAGEYLAWFWQTKYFRRAPVRVGIVGWAIVLVYAALFTGMLYGSVLCFQAGRWQLGVALLITYPLVLAHVLAIFVVIGKIFWYVVHPKKLLRWIVCVIIEHQVVRLRRKHSFTVVAVAGSVGKTSTKFAIAQMLESAGKRVLIQEGNYNDRVTVPLVLFGSKLEGLFNPAWWLKTIRHMRRIVRSKAYEYDVVVLELGTDGPGQLRHFAYLQPEVGVLTAVAPEHMEYFKTLDAVADEELVILDFSKKKLVNADDIDAQYLQGYKYKSYGIDSEDADFRVSKRAAESLHGQTLSLYLRAKKVTSPVKYLGKQGATIALAAAASGDLLDLSEQQISDGLQSLKPFSGRMQILEGIKNTTIIDDTYNASPLAVKAALDVVYAAKAPQKIAVLGDMNELGDTSSGAHMDIGKYCNPKELDIVITIGPESKHYISPEAKIVGCRVESFDSPYKAGEFIKEYIKDGALILVKGSQNRVFAEEAIKVLLKNKSDETKLVRQSKTWLAIKSKQFNV